MIRHLPPILLVIALFAVLFTSPVRAADFDFVEADVAWSEPAGDGFRTFGLQAAYSMTGDGEDGAATLRLEWTTEGGEVLASETVEHEFGGSGDSWFEWTVAESELPTVVTFTVHDDSDATSASAEVTLVALTVAASATVGEEMAPGIYAVVLDGEVAGGVGPYTTTWSNQETGVVVATQLDATISVSEEKLSEGLYLRLDVTDEANGGTASAFERVVFEPPCPPLVVTANASNEPDPTQPGTNTVTLDGEHSGGCGPYRYEWRVASTGEVIATTLDTTWSVAADRLPIVVTLVVFDQEDNNAGVTGWSLNAGGGSACNPAEFDFEGAVIVGDDETLTRVAGTDEWIVCSPPSGDGDETTPSPTPRPSSGSADAVIDGSPSPSPTPTPSGPATTPAPTAPPWLPNTAIAATDPSGIASFVLILAAALIVVGVGWVVIRCAKYGQS